MLPAAVLQNRDTMGVNYNAIIAALIEAIKEQHAIIGGLEKSMAEIKNSVEELKKVSGQGKSDPTGR